MAREDAYEVKKKKKNALFFCFSFFAEYKLASFRS